GNFTADNKVYDGNASATVLTRTLNGVLGSDAVTLTGGTAAFNDKTVANGKTVTLTGSSLAGADAGNYSLTSVGTTTANITARLLIVIATGVNKIYDGTTVATVNLSTDKVNGDAVAAAYSTANFATSIVGTGIAVSVNGISISSADATNYSLVNTTASTTANIDIASTTTTLTLSAQSVRYMDNVTFTAVVKPLNTGSPLTGTVKFIIGAVDYGTANVVPIPGATDGSVQAMLITQMKNTELPGEYTVYASFTSTNTNYVGSTNISPLKVTPRSATYVGTGFYTGDVFVWTPTETSSTGTVALVATIKDANTPSGDVRGAKVTFYYVNNGVYTAIPSASNLPVGLVDITDGSIGTASAIVQLNIGSQNSASYTIAVGISGAYINKKTEPTAIAVITVAKPLPGGYVVAGGSLLNSASSGMLKGAPGVETGFSMDVKFNNKNTNPQGKSYVTFWSYYKSDGTLDNVLHHYEITSNAIAVFAVGQTSSKRDASFSSKSNLVEVLENGTTVGIDTGITLQLTMTDNGKGTTDLFGITLQRKAGGVWFSSNWNVTKTQEQLLHTGNVYVSTSGLSQSIAKITNSKGYIATTENVISEPVPFNIAVYPNPSAHYFSIDIKGGSTEKTEVFVYDMLGRMVEHIQNNTNQEIKFGEDLAAGSYLAIIKQGDKQKTVKLIKQ
ncbi:YDG domain-containing protein, partial [Flavobacterium yafengii]